MILVSCRRDFTSNQKFAEGNSIRDYPNLSDLARYREMEGADLIERVRGRHVVILVHGFRNPIANVARAYRGIEETLRRQRLMTEAAYGEVIGFLWPGAVSVSGFFAAIPLADKSAWHLYSLLRLLGTAAKTADVQTHSLGARVALQALAAQDDVFVDNLMLTAPAVDDESLEPRREFHASLEACNRAFVFHSKEDAVLKAYVVAQFDLALGSGGPERPKVIETECRNVYVVDSVKAVRKDHSGYRKAPSYFTHWKRILTGEPLPRFDALSGA